MPRTPKTTTRTAKTPRQRAEEALGVTERAADRLQTKLDAARVAADALTVELAAAKARLEHARQNPDLVDDAGQKATT